MSRLAKGLVASSLLTLGGGCSGLPPGIGSNHEVTIIADDVDWARYDQLLAEVFERLIWTPQEEKIFAIERSSPDKFGFYRKMKNVVLISPLDGEGKTAEIIRSLLSREASIRVREGKAFVFLKRNVWAREQAMMILTANDGQTLEERLRQNKDRIFQVMEQALNDKIAAWLYKDPEQKELARGLWERYGWKMRIPEGYSIGRELPEEHFVWLRKQRPHRWIFVWWEVVDDSSIALEWCLAKRNEIGERHYEGDQVTSDHLLVEETTFNGRTSTRLSGLWHNPARGVGGPFHCYAFYDRESKRRYLIDVAVFAPGVEKEPYLRQVDIIAHTFTAKGG